MKKQSTRKPIGYNVKLNLIGSNWKAINRYICVHSSKDGNLGKIKSDITDTPKFTFNGDIVFNSSSYVKS